MSVHCKHTVMTTFEGPMDEVLQAQSIAPPTMEEIVASLKELAFIAETVAHLQGKEEALLPAADRARSIIRKINL